MENTALTINDLWKVARKKWFKITEGALAVGIAFATAGLMVSYNDIESAYVSTLPNTNITEGKIEQTFSTGKEVEEGKPLWMQYYSFEVGGHTYYEEQLTSWTYQAGDVVKVEYDSDNPQLSKIHLSERNIFLLLIGGISCIALLFHGGSILRNEIINLRKTAHIVKNGISGYAVLRRESRDKKGIYTLTYEYKAGSYQGTLIKESHERQKYRKKEVFLYLESSPDQAILFKDLPKPVQQKQTITITPNQALNSPPPNRVIGI